MNLEWEEEFRKRFVYEPPAELTPNAKALLLPYQLKTPEGGVAEVIDFIQETRKQAVLDSLKRVREGIPQEETRVDSDGDGRRKIGFNEMRSQTLSLLNEEERRLNETTKI